VVASLLVLLLPVFLVISLLIRLESPGPVLFRQPRIGWRGNTFTMLKFRTMKPDRRKTMKPDRRNAERPFQRTDRRQSFKSVGDPRVTPLGQFLRRSSLDELPQLINVLRGEMSLVGPRPEQVEMLRYYRPEHYRRHAAVPGLTGWWQVNGRCERGNRARPEDDLARKLRDDEEYIKNRSFWFDVRILLLTVPVVLRQRGAW
jgi:lipopolysaccharide/colanic/teichoic acid biosynthesis glycosyltransferase